MPPSSKWLLPVIALTGAVCVGLGIYLVFNKSEAPQSGQTSNLGVTETGLNKSENSLPIVGSPNCVVAYTSGSCWTIKPPAVNPCFETSRPKPLVKINEEGSSVTIIVPATMAQGVKAASGNREFYIKPGEDIEIKSSGRINFSSDHPCADPEGLPGWYDPGVDSPFNQNVGGLEFSIGPLSNNRFFAGRYYRARVETSGVPVLRVIERLANYNDGNGGAFTVTINKIQ